MLFIVTVPFIMFCSISYTSAAPSLAKGWDQLCLTTNLIWYPLLCNSYSHMCALNPCVIILCCKPLVFKLPFHNKHPNWITVGYSYRQISKADLQVVVKSLSVYQARDREPLRLRRGTLPQIYIKLPTNNQTGFNVIIFHFNIRGKLSIIRCDKQQLLFQRDCVYWLHLNT